MGLGIGFDAVKDSLASNPQQGSNSGKNAFGAATDEIKKKRKTVADAKARSLEIAGQMENPEIDPGELAALQQEAQAGIDSSWHDAGANVAESFARRGLGSSGMAQAEQYDLADKRNKAVEDATFRARAQAEAAARSKLAEEQTALTGIQTSDINAQRLSMEQQAYYDKLLADAVAGLGEVGGTYYAEAEKKKKDQAAKDAALAQFSLGGMR